MSDAAPRSPRRRNVSLARQAVEGIGIVTVLSLLGAGLGYLAALVVSWIF